MTQVWREWGADVVVSLAGLPVAALLAVVLTRFRTRRGVPAGLAWRSSACEVGIVAGTLPWVWMILTPREAPRQTWLVPLTDLANQVRHTSPGSVAVQFGGNLVVFAALGFLAPIRFPALAGVWRLLALGAAGSVLVETLQYVLDLGRVTSIDDVGINALGAALAGLASRPWWGSASGSGRDRSSTKSDDKRPLVPDPPAAATPATTRR